MSVDHLITQFVPLNPAAVEDTLNAVRAHPSRGDFLGKTQDGAPVFLIADDDATSYRPEVRHLHLRVSFGMSCRLNVNGKELTSQFAVVRLERGASELNELFIRCVHAAMFTLPDSVGTLEIESRVSRLLSLFQALSTPSSRELSGFWAELLCIRCSPNPARTLAYWRSNQAETFDFSWAGNRAEVKSTTAPHRIHEFSLEQLTRPPSGNGTVISVMLRPSNDGVGVMDLAQDIEAALEGIAELREKLWSQVLQSLGNDFSNALDRKFDVDFALRHLAVFAVQNIPSVNSPLDSRITSVRFKVDLAEQCAEVPGGGAAALRAVFG